VARCGHLLDPSGQLLGDTYCQCHRCKPRARSGGATPTASTLPACDRDHRDDTRDPDFVRDRARACAKQGSKAVSSATERMFHFPVQGPFCENPLLAKLPEIDLPSWPCRFDPGRPLHVLPGQLLTLWQSNANMAHSWHNQVSARAKYAGQGDPWATASETGRRCLSLRWHWPTGVGWRS
jgi:hypothetical protein